MTEMHVFYSTMFATLISALPGFWSVVRTYRITARQEKQEKLNKDAHTAVVAAIDENTTITKEVESHTNGIVQKLADTTRAEGVSEGVAQEQSAQAVRNQTHR